MKSKQPPFIGTWVIEHLTCSRRNDALSGDLLEEFRSGRSSAWYWRQVLAAVATSYVTEAQTRSLLVVFAALWTIPAKAWWPFAMWPAAYWAGLIFPWPYSTMLGEGAVVIESLWVGLGVYALLHSRYRGNMAAGKIFRAFWVGPLVFMLLTAAIQIMSHPLGIPIASRGALKLITYFLSLVAGAWGVGSNAKLKFNSVGSPAG